MEPIDYRDFAALARKHKGKCVLFARHAERPSLLPDDPSYGTNLPITEAGRAMAIRCGRDLRKAGPVSDWSFWSSALLRTRLTAEAVAQGIGIPSPVVHDSVEAGIPGRWWYTAPELTFQGYQTEGSSNYNNRYFLEGSVPGYLPIGESARRTLEWLRDFDFGSRLAFVASHDVFIAVLLQGIGIRRFRSSNWIGFVQAAGLLFSPDGSYQAYYCVPDKNDYEDIALA